MPRGLSEFASLASKTRLAGSSAAVPALCLDRPKLLEGVRLNRPVSGGPPPAWRLRPSVLSRGGDLALHVGTRLQAEPGLDPMPRLVAVSRVLDFAKDAVSVTLLSHRRGGVVVGNGSLRMLWGIGVLMFSLGDRTWRVHHSARFLVDA